jgi:hypothetical protein
MLETRVLVSRTKIERKDVAQVLAGLAARDWPPAIFESQRYFLKLAGVQDKMQVPLPKADPFGRFRAGAPGDVFFKGEDLYYVICHSQDRDSRYERDMYYERQMFLFEEEQVSEAIEIGIMSNEADGIEIRLNAFAEAVQNVILSSLDGRKTRHLDSKWSRLSPGQARIDKLTKTSEREGAKFETPSIAPEEIAAAHLLCDKKIRDLLIQISKAGVARAHDIVTSEEKPDAKANLRTLVDGSLLGVEYLLECKKRRNQLMKLATKEQLEKADIQQLVCPYCGARFGEEAISEIYHISELGKKILAGSHWMTVLVTNKLVQLGAPTEGILWNVSESGEEVDVIMEFMGRLFIFELKDREFGSGDAHPFNYSQVKYNADRAIIITTDKVSQDAKKVFQDLSKMANREKRIRVVYVEGLAKLDNVLGEEISSSVLAYAHGRLGMLGYMSGHDLIPILNARFGEAQSKRLVEALD